MQIPAWIPLSACLACCCSALCGTITLTPVADASIYQGPDPDASNGAGPHFFVGVNRGGEARRALLRFDFSAIPAGATIESVSLTLTVTRNLVGAIDLSLHPVLGSWNEGTTDAGEPGGQGSPAAPGDCTWNFREFGSTAWSAPGGDHAAAPSATTNVPGYGTFAWSSAEMAADVQAWIDGTSPNHGWLLRSDETTSFNAKRFATRENSDAGLRPALVVSFAPPPCEGDYDSSGTVNFSDITFVLGAWGAPFGFNDITTILANWDASC